MAMPIGGQDDEVLSTINTTPLVDVMLVLLIIFLITIPVVTSSIPVELPKERHERRETTPETVIVTVDRAGQIYLYDTPVPSAAQLTERLQKLATQQPPPEVQIRGDGASDFEAVGRVMHAAQRAGITRLGFITEPAGR